MQLRFLFVAGAGDAVQAMLRCTVLCYARVTMSLSLSYLKCSGCLFRKCFTLGTAGGRFTLVPSCRQAGGEGSRRGGKHSSQSGWWVSAWGRSAEPATTAHDSTQPKNCRTINASGRWLHTLARAPLPA